ncbi:hypothetical protein ASF19_20015 [Acidovorax sp. Leaf84]|uniref:YdaS family helix-turn-helix protein n=1 Tax=Acidovorax sp. Leaf84 TaxID=1736240 RepID=UPI0006F21A04|nr:hypothetical protein ASF19_20015 [Acidovorax sp. Leaf84]
MNLENWLGAERGRQKALAAHLGLTVGRISQMADGGVPPKYMLAVRDFTKGEVTLEALVQARTANTPLDGPTATRCFVVSDSTEQAA